MVLEYLDIKDPRAEFDHCVLIFANFDWGWYEIVRRGATLVAWIESWVRRGECQARRVKYFSIIGDVGTPRKDLS